MSRIQLRRDTSTKWGLINPVLAEGEIGIDTTLRRFKLGDGVTSWGELDWETINSNEKGAPNGVAPLGPDGTILDEYINFPEFPEIHNFEYFDNPSQFPETGAFNTLYLSDALDDTGLQFWAWGGGDPPDYVPVSKSPQATELIYGLIRLTGDLGGGANNPIVKKVNGVEIVGGPPTAGKVLKATSATQASWQNDAVGGGGGEGGEDARIGLYEETIGNGTADPITITHGLASRQLHVSMTRVGGDCEIVNILFIKAPSIHAIVFTPDRVIEESGWRITIMASLGLADITPPTQPTITVTDESSISITAEADDTTDDVAIAEYKWFIKEHAAGGLPQYVATTTVPVYTFPGLNGATQYDVAVSAVDTSGNESDMSDAVPHTTDVPANVIFLAHGGPGARRNNAAGSLATPEYIQNVPAGFAKILLVGVTVTHANSIRWDAYNSLTVTSSIDGALTKVPDSSKNVYSDGASEAYGSVHWFYKLNPTVGDHGIVVNWSDNQWADGLRAQSVVYANVDQSTPFNGSPVLYGASTSNTTLNVTRPSVDGNKSVIAIGASGIMTGFNKTQRGDSVGSSTQGFCDYLQIVESDGAAPSVVFTSSGTAIHCASAIDLKKVS